MCYNKMYVPKTPCVGLVAVSRAGHDKGRAYGVVAVLSDEFVLCCDGDVRKLDHPKQKRMKHLVPVASSQVIFDALRQGNLTDDILKKELRKHNA